MCSVSITITPDRAIFNATYKNRITIAHVLLFYAHRHGEKSRKEYAEKSFVI